LKSYEDQGNKKLDPEDIAMDFFRGLDNVRYSTFKTDYINGLTSKAMDPPKDLNEIYLLANQWLKPKAAGTGYASTFATMLDHLDDRRNPGEEEEIEAVVSNNNNNKKRNSKEDCSLW
jgi:hypothetical protein